MCLSHTQTIRIIDQAASNYAKEIMEWKAAVEQYIENTSSMVNYMYLYIYVCIMLKHNTGEHTDALRFR